MEGVKEDIRPLQDWEAVRRWWLANQGELSQWHQQAAEALPQRGQIEEAVEASAFTELVKRRKFQLRSGAAPATQAAEHKLDVETKKRKAEPAGVTVPVPAFWKSTPTGKLVHAVTDEVPLCKWRQTYRPFKAAPLSADISELNEVVGWGRKFCPDCVRKCPLNIQEQVTKLGGPAT